MLSRCSTKKLFKQIIDIGRRTCNSVQHNVPQLFYNNYEAINYFIQFLRKREAIETPIKYSNYRTERKVPGMYVSLGAPNASDFFVFQIKHWWARKRNEYFQFMERSYYKENMKFGPDLAAAMFVIKFGGKVKFKGQNEWLDKTKTDEISKLPKKYDPSYILEKLDLNKYPLRYEHLHFIFNLYSLTFLSLKGCKSIDDWALDKLSAEFPRLEHLDISGCKKVTERGLEALYRMPSLKKLSVTNFQGTAAFDLTCLLLEDVNPYLTCEIQQLKYKTLPVK